MCERVCLTSGIANYLLKTIVKFSSAAAVAAHILTYFDMYMNYYSCTFQFILISEGHSVAILCEKNHYFPKDRIPIHFMLTSDGKSDRVSGAKISDRSLNVS